MRPDVAAALMVAMFGIAAPAVAASGTAQFVYQNEKGRQATLDPQAATLAFAGHVIRLSDCSDADRLCFVSGEVRIEAPRQCRPKFDVTAFVKGSKGIQILSLDGLSDGIYFFERTQRRFGYAFSPSQGLIRLVILTETDANPLEGDIGGMASGGNAPLEAIYTLTSATGPWVCAR